MPIYSTDGVYISYAIGKVLTAWRNGDAILIAADLLKATDKLDARQNIAIDYTDPDTEETGHMSSSQYKIRHTAGYKLGRVVSVSYTHLTLPTTPYV